MDLTVLCIGDVVGRPGLRAVGGLLSGIRERHGVDMVVANGENAHSSGNGIGAREFRVLREAGVDCVTLGDHVWRRHDLRPELDKGVDIIRPANLPKSACGRGWVRLETVHGPLVVVNLIGRVFLDPAGCPFEAADHILETIGQEIRFIVVDFHAEATSEKIAMSWALDGRVSAVVGTHTHVQTADERILPEGTAALTDLGMTGPHASVLGRRVDRVLNRMRTSMHTPFDVAGDDIRLQGALIRIDPETGRARSIQRIDERLTP